MNRLSSFPSPSAPVRPTGGGVSLLIAFLLAGALTFTGGPARAAEDGTTRAVGVGLTAESAAADARSNAVKQVVGEFIQSEEQVRNEKLIKDEVLSASDGFIESSETLVPPRKGNDGIFQTEIRAVVRRERVRDRLKEIRVITATDPAQFTDEQFRTANRDDARKILLKYAPTLPARLLRARVVDDRGQDLRHPLLNGQAGGRDMGCAWNIEVRFDPDAYADAADKLQRLLDVVIDRPMRGEVAATLPDAYHGDPAARRLNYATARTVRWESRERIVSQKLYPPRKRDELPIALNIPNGRDLVHQSFRWYVLPGEYVQAFDALAQPVSLSVDVVDRAGKVLAHQNLSLASTLLEPQPGGRPPKHATLDIAAEEVKMQGAALAYSDTIPFNAGGMGQGNRVPLVITPDFQTAPHPGARAGRLSGGRFVSDSIVVRYQTVLPAADANNIQELRLSFVEAAGR